MPQRARKNQIPHVLRRRHVLLGGLNLIPRLRSGYVVSTKNTGIPPGFLLGPLGLRGR
jgi:hypothetical protein